MGYAALVSFFDQLGGCLRIVMHWDQLIGFVLLMGGFVWRRRTEGHSLIQSRDV